MAREVAVIGCGIVGVCTAMALTEDGYRVTLVEPGPIGGEQAASFGNGAWISPASVVPISMPGIWKKIPGYLLDETGPLTIRWRDLPRLLPWLMRFIAAGFTEERVQKAAGALATLLLDSPEQHRRIAEAIGRPELIRSSGLLYAYPGRQEFEAEELAWRLRRQNGVCWEEIEADALHDLEPSLCKRYTFAAFVRNGAHCFDPGFYVASIVGHLLQVGVRLVRARATDFEIAGGRLKSVRTDTGAIECDAAVIAAGIHSKYLAARCGDCVPVESERGYHVVIPSPDAGPSIPVMSSDSKAANTRVSAGFRIAGQVEIAAVDAPPNWRRPEILLQQAINAYPSLDAIVQSSGKNRWMGHRPSTPDGLPIICHSSATRDVIYAFGHGHVGLASAPATARLVSALVSERSSVSNHAFSLERFRRRCQGTVKENRVETGRAVS